jgi:hypothetical protein
MLRVSPTVFSFNWSHNNTNRRVQIINSLNTQFSPSSRNFYSLALKCFLQGTALKHSLWYHFSISLQRVWKRLCDIWLLLAMRIMKMVWGVTSCTVAGRYQHIKDTYRLHFQPRTTSSWNEDCYLLGCSNVSSGRYRPTFQRSLLPPSSAPITPMMETDTPPTTHLRRRKREEDVYLLLIQDLGTRCGEWSASRPGRSLPPGQINGLRRPELNNRLRRNI